VIGSATARTTAAQPAFAAVLSHCGRLSAVPIEVRLEDESGNVVTVEDPSGGTCNGAGGFDRLLPRDDVSYRCLGVVDPYGETVFNRLQMPFLLDDLARLDAASAKEGERRGLLRLEALARRCREGTHLYLHFIGD
jgi:hypothetical protein